MISFQEYLNKCYEDDYLNSLPEPYLYDMYLDEVVYPKVGC